MSDLVAIGDPDSNVPVALVTLQINPTEGVRIMDALGVSPGEVDILLTGCVIDFSGMHLDRAQPGHSYVSVVAKANGVALVPKAPRLRPRDPG